MKRSTIVLPVLALTVLAAATVYVKYDDWVAFPKHREVVKALLKDPESAQFKGEFISSSGWFCGEVNSKNGLGGYVGFEKFISSKDESYLESQGYVGPEPERFEQAQKRILAGLDERIDISTRAEKLTQEGKVEEAKAMMRSSNEATIQSSVNKKLFQQKWSQVCA